MIDDKAQFLIMIKIFKVQKEIKQTKSKELERELLQNRWQEYL